MAPSHLMDLQGKPWPEFSVPSRVLPSADVLICQLRLLKSTLKQLLGFYTVVKLFVGYS